MFTKFSGKHKASIFMVEYSGVDPQHTFLSNPESRNLYLRSR